MQIRITALSQMSGRDALVTLGTDEAVGLSPSDDCGDHERLGCSAGSLRRFERAESIRLGRGRREDSGGGRAQWAGLGKGLNSAVNSPGPIKHEAMPESSRVFRLSSAFGLAEPEKVTGLKLPIKPLTSVIECVDDVKSLHYNSIVDRSRVASRTGTVRRRCATWVEQYRLGVVVDHNFDPRMAAGRRSASSCTSGRMPQTGTSGGTAMVA